MTGLVASRKRLLIFSDEGDREHLGVMHDKAWTVSNHWSLGDLGDDVSCVTRWADVPLDRREPGFRGLFTMSHHRNVPTVINAALDNGAKLRDRIDRTCRPAAAIPTSWRSTSTASPTAADTHRPRSSPG
ncbi:PI-PLC domain-containing protein [Streptomyces omiyaensis]|uniref:hypothetical protein n=1 Tax=Streptomyces omiyaensis TaxID=68247 RepID=UPI0036FFAA86